MSASRISPMSIVAVTTGITTVVLSMALNVWAFTERMPGGFGWCVGLLLPLWILAATFAGHHCWQQKHTRLIGTASYALAGFMLLVSLPHLAHGYDQITGVWWESWSLAIVTDLLQVTMKLVVITLHKRPKQTSKRKVKGTKRTALAA